MPESTMSEPRSNVSNEGTRRVAILHVSTTMGETAGSYNELALPMRHKHDVTVCTYFKLPVSPPPEIAVFSGDGSLRGFLRQLEAALAARVYDIVHVHAVVAGALFLVTSLLRGRSIRSSVYTVQNSYQNYKLRNRLLLIPIFAAYRRVVCCSEACRESFPSLYRWLAGSRLCTVQNAVNTERIARVVGDRRRREGSRPFTVISVGRLIEIKHPLTVLDAFQSADLTGDLRYVGEGHLRDRVLERSKELPPDKHVSVTGLIPRDSVYENLAQADLFVTASHGEGLPVATLEAMACGCSVVLSDIAPHREIAPGVDFIPLVHPEDVQGFSREMERFARMSPAERASVGEKCRRLVEERFGLAAMHRAYEKVYGDVLRGRPAITGR